MATLNQAQQESWLQKDIPHRIRAALPGLRIKGPWGVDFSPQADPLSNRCVGDSIWEGRLAALRWLISFVGVVERKGKADRPNLKKTDVTIGDIVGGVQFSLVSLDAMKLARVWKGCSQGSSHPTVSTNHPRVDEPEQADALLIVIGHLEKTIYVAANLDLRSVTLKA